MNAKQLVNKLLEYGLDPNAPAPGSPNDPWRQGGGQPIKFNPGDFEGQRGAQPSGPDGSVPIKHGAPVPPLNNRKKVPPKRDLGGLGGRMSWTPPQE